VFFFFFFFACFCYEYCKFAGCNFSNCNSTGGSGGAIASNSSLTTTTRTIIGTNFSNCVGGTSNRGNDYADINSVTAVAALYTYNTLINIISSSNSIKFYFEAKNVSMDCLIDDTCGTMSSVYVNNASGEDIFYCGSEDEPCSGVDFAWSNRLPTNGTMYLYNGTYGLSIRYGSVFVKRFIGVGDITSENDYPIMYSLGTSANATWLNLSYDGSQVFFEKIKIRYQGVFNTYLFYTYYSSNIVNMTNGFIVSNSYAYHSYIFYTYGGLLYFVNTTFQTHNFSSYMVGFYSYTTSNKFFFINSTFKDIMAYYCMFQWGSASPVLNVTGCTFSNISIMYQGGYAHVFYSTVTSASQYFSNNTFANMTGPRSTFSVQPSSVALTYTGLVFSNITANYSNYGGAAFYIYSTSYAFNFTNCSFTRCRTTYSTINGGFYFFLYC
jgi:hypothetical protein